MPAKNFSNPSFTSPNRLLIVVQAIVLIVVSAVWLYLWRSPIWSIDDLYFVTRDGLPWGNTTPSLIYNDFIYDVFERNGRTADIVLQLIFASTTHLAIVFPLICLGFSFSIYALAISHLPTSRKPGFGSLSQTLVAVISLCSLFLISAFADSTPGTTIMFMAAAVGYLGGIILFALTVLQLKRLWTKHTLLNAILFVLLTIISAWHHEVVSAILFAYFTLFLLTQEKLHKVTTAVTLTGIAITLFRFATPGMWARRGAPRELFPDASWIHSKIATTMLVFHDYLLHHRTFAVITVISIFLLSMLSYLSYQKANHFLLGLMITNAAAIVVCILCMNRLTNLKYASLASGAQFTQIYLSKTALLGFVAFLIHLATLLTFFIYCRRTHHAVIFLPLATAYSGLLFLLLGRTLAERPMFFTHALLIACFAVAVATVCVSVQTRSQTHQWSYRILAGISLASVILISFKAFSPTLTFFFAVNENTSVQDKVLSEIENVRNGKSTSFRIPSVYPHKKYFDWYQPRGTVKERYVQYYNLPTDTLVTDVPPEDFLR